MKFQKYNFNFYKNWEKKSLIPLKKFKNPQNKKNVYTHPAYGLQNRSFL